MFNDSISWIYIFFWCIFFHPLLRYKPALASSEAGLGVAGNAVDGIPTIVHEGRKCSETRKEKSPWWTVDLLTVQVSNIVIISVDIENMRLISSPHTLDLTSNSTAYFVSSFCNQVLCVKLGLNKQSMLYLSNCTALSKLYCPGGLLSKHGLYDICCCLLFVTVLIENNQLGYYWILPYSAQGCSLYLIRPMRVLSVRCEMCNTWCDVTL